MDIEEGGRRGDWRRGGLVGTGILVTWWVTRKRIATECHGTRGHVTFFLLTVSSVRDFSCMVTNQGDNGLVPPRQKKNPACP